MRRPGAAAAKEFTVQGINPLDPKTWIVGRDGGARPRPGPGPPRTPLTSSD